MRDIIVTLVVVGLLPFILRTPRLGAYAWAWVSMMIPHRLTYGFARTLPFAQMVALATLVGMLFTRERRPFPVNAITITQIIFLLWMSFTCLFALNTHEIVTDRWIMVMKIQLMLFATLMLVRGRKHIEQLIWVVTFSIGIYGVKGGIWTLMTGGGGRVWGPPGGIIEGNNELGLALVMLMPFMYYLQQISTKRWLRYGLVFCMVTSCFGILGTQSRGAMLALVTMAFVLGLKGKYPIRTSVGIVALLSIAFVFMPDSWSGRMETIQTFDQDTSAMSRIYTWKTLWNLALDRPLVGAGFATDNPLVFSLYAPPEGAGVYTAGGVFVAHSIYFQALGEHGFPGLFIYLTLGLVTWFKAARIAKQTKDDPEFGAWVPLLMRMVQVSLAGFAVGGAFLTLVHFDLTYYIIGYVVLVDATLRERAKELAKAPPKPVAPLPATA